MKHSNIKDFISKVCNKFFNPDIWVWLFPLLLTVPNFALCITEHYTALAKIANIVLPFGLYLLMLSWSRNTGRTIYCMLPFAVLAAFQIVLLFLYGESIIAIDMFINVATTNVSEATELLGNLMIAIIVILLIYLPPLIAAAVMWIRRLRATESLIRRSRKIGGIVTVCGGVLVVVCMLFVKSYRIDRQLFPVNVISNMITAIARTSQAQNYHKSSADFTYGARSMHDADAREIYVLIVGETARADNWQLFGYERPTNPRLSQREGVTPFPYAMSEINTTHKSVPMLMSWLDAETFGDNVNTSRSIFEAFNTSGYRTVYISNQGRNHSYIDFFGQEADTSTFLTDNGGEHPDFDLLNPLAEVLADTTAHKIFVVLHTYGSHFNYSKRYSRDMAHFLPDSNTGANPANRRDLINAYDNSQLYTDALIDSAISIVNARHVPAALMYASDHGEDIFDDSRERFLHASPVPTYWQLHVAMLAWTSPEFKARYPQKTRNLNQNHLLQVSSTKAIFHTMLDLAGLRTTFFKPSQSLASPTYRQPKRLYLNDYNEAVPYPQAGLYPNDFTQMRAHGINPE